MSYAFDSRLGEQLYRLLPEVYRTRDKKTVQAVEGSGTEDLAKYLDAHGHLLDLIHATLEQQLRDALPKSSQDWLLPYFAQLLAANIVSPDSRGKHAEISHAVSWRQRKGTLKCVEEIAEAVGQMEVEIQEGWKRVAMTPRISMPIIPAQALDAKLEKIDMTVPSEAIRHPTLPAAMVDLRWPSRAVEAPATNPAARISSFGGVKQTWRQANLHGVPCFPGSFDDVSRRTVDIRTPDTTKGHYHHKRLLAYAPPPAGLFPFDPIQLTWAERLDSLYEHLIEEKEENGVWLIRNKTNRIIEITDDVTLRPAEYDLNLMTEDNTDDLVDQGRSLVIVALIDDQLHIRIFDASGEKIVDKGENELPSGEALTILKQLLSTLPQESDLSQEDKQKIIENVTLSAGHTRPANTYRVEGLNFKTKLSVDVGDSLELHRIEAVEVQVDTFSTDKPVLTAKDCLFNELSVGAGTAKLDSCTILVKAILKDVDAVNCIFNDFEYNEDVLITGKVRYSRIPLSLKDHIQDKKHITNCATEAHEFFGERIKYDIDNKRDNNGAGVLRDNNGAGVLRDNNGAGVLRPDCDPSIYAGASDGREMGYFHHGRKGRPVRIAKDFTNTDALTLQTIGGYPLEDVVFEGNVEVDSGKLKLRRVAVQEITVGSNGDNLLPVLDAKDCLFDKLTFANGLARLEYCTIMDKADCKHLEASDCIFIGKITVAAGNERESGCVRYSRIPEGFDGSTLNVHIGRTDTNTREKPVFIKFDYCNDGTHEHRMAMFGEPGYGVLDPVTPDAVRFGAEDGGEMGAYHHKYYSLKAEAVLDKMREFLPVGIEPVLIQDTRLLHVPPEQKKTNII